MLLNDTPHTADASCAELYFAPPAVKLAHTAGCFLVLHCQHTYPSHSSQHQPLSNAIASAEFGGEGYEASLL